MIKVVLVLSVVVFGSFIQTDSCSPLEKNSKPITESAADQTKAAEKFLSISELNSEKQDKGIFETRGFVAKIYTCPPCPADAQCKPCMVDNIVISEEKKNLETYDLSKKEMIIFTDKSKDFEKGTEYKFKIEISDKKTTGSNLNDARLIDAKKKSV